MTGGDVTPLGGKAVTQLHQVGFSNCDVTPLGGKAVTQLHQVGFSNCEGAAAPGGLFLTVKYVWDGAAPGGVFKL